MKQVAVIGGDFSGAYITQKLEKEFSVHYLHLGKKPVEGVLYFTNTIY